MVVTVVVALGFLGYLGDHAVSGREADALLDRAVAAQGTVAYSNRRVAATVDYTRPQLFGPSVPARVRAGLKQLIADSARSQVASLRTERSSAAAVHVVGWHHQDVDARAALVRYLDARVAYLQSVAADPDVLYVEHPDLERLLDAARAAYRLIAPSARVDAVFAGGTHPG